MTFYQELQLNQAGSKNLLKKSETTKEKMYHILVYLDRKSTRLNSSHRSQSRMPSSA